MIHASAPPSPLTASYRSRAARSSEKLLRLKLTPAQQNVFVRKCLDFLLGVAADKTMLLTRADCEYILGGIARGAGPAREIREKIRALLAEPQA